MFHKKLCVAFIAFLLIHGTVQGKKSRKNKRPKPDEEDYTPQPSVVSYSTFGFNDVGTYEGFVPSSPDYTKFLTGVNPETNSKEHTSSFSTSPDSNDFGHSFNSQPYSEQTFNLNEDGGSPPGLVQYPPSSTGPFSNPSFDNNIDQHRNIATEEVYGKSTEEINSPTYGTKLNSKNRIRAINDYNNKNLSGTQNDEKLINFNEAKPIFDNRPYQEIKSTFENGPSQSEFSNPFSNALSQPSQNTVDNNKPVSSDSQNPFKFQRVVDFTKVNQFYPTELDTSRLPPTTSIPDLYQNNEATHQLFSPYNGHNYSNNFLNPTTKQKQTFKENNNDDALGKNTFKNNKLKEDYNSYNSYTSGIDNVHLPSDIANKKKIKPWLSDGHQFKTWKEPSSANGYEYSTNFSSMSFKYDADENKFKKPLGSGLDEIIPASSNIDFPNYQYPDTDFSHFKKMPEYKVHEEDEIDDFPSHKQRYKPYEFDYNQYKYLYSTVPTTTAYWANALKSSDLTSVKSHSYSNKYKYRDSDEIVNIPRRPSKYKYDNPFENKFNEWSQSKRRPHKHSPYKDWTSDIPKTRFKSEEDLLDLRNQDTSHPSYLPSYHSSNFVSDDEDYKKLVDKWRQSYWKNKYKDSLRDYETYGSETKPMHVPVPKPYPIEVPRPVIVPVPQPYPIQVPIAKPVAVPIIREIKIPIEKPMPYLVYKDVPFPVEKLVPVRVEKEVPVPVSKPYPVHIPYIKPVFHHTKSRDEYDSDHRDDDEYLPRYEGNKNKYPHYKKKIPNSTRHRPRRPSRNAYQERNRRRWPERRHPVDVRDEHRMRNFELKHPSPFKRRNSEDVRFEEQTKNNYPRI